MGFNARNEKVGKEVEMAKKKEWKKNGKSEKRTKNKKGKKRKKKKSTLPFH